MERLDLGDFEAREDNPTIDESLLPQDQSYYG